MATVEYVSKGEVRDGARAENRRGPKSRRDPKLRPRRIPGSPPDLNYLRALKASMLASYQVQDLQIDTMRQLREQTEPVPIPDELRRVDAEMRDSTITDEVARVVASITHNDPTCQVTPLRVTDIGQQNASEREHWSEELLLRDAGVKIPGVPCWESATDGCLADGGGWTKLVFLSHTWEQAYGIPFGDYSDDEGYPSKGKSGAAKYHGAREDTKKLAGSALAWLPVDVRSVYPVWDGNQITEVLEITERATLDTLARHHLGYDGKRGEFYERVGPSISPSDTENLPPTLTFLEHWDETFCTYAVESGDVYHVIKSYEHHYGRHPYFWAPGLMHNHWRGRKVGWGVAASKEHLVRFKSFLQSLAIQEVAQQVGKPVIRRRANPAESMIGENKLPKDSEEWPLNQLLNWDARDEAVAWPVEPITAALQQLIAMVSEEVDRLTTPRIQGDIAGGGLEGAGFAVNQVLTEAKTKHHPFVSSLERMLADVTRFAWHLVRDVVEEEVYVQWTDRGAKRGRRHSQFLGLGPDDLAEGVGVKWEVHVEQPSADMIKNRYWNERLQAGTAHIDQVVEALGDDPDEVRRGRAMDRIRSQPWYIEAYDREILQGLRRGDLMRKAAELAAATGLLPGMPPEFAAQVMGQGGPMGGAGMPGDEASLAFSPNAVGAAPIQNPTPGVGPGAVVPQLAAGAGIQNLGV